MVVVDVGMDRELNTTSSDSKTLPSSDTAPLLPASVRSVVG